MLLITFLITAIIISLSGVMMPGPVLASAIVEGHNDRYAGTKIAVGHAFIEFPIMFAIFLGLGYIFTYNWVKAAIGTGGGLLLLFLGWKMIEFGKKGRDEEPVLRNPWILGTIVSASSPYFFLWWATVGASLIIKAIEIGFFAFILFTIAHWLCDLAWYSFVSFTTFKSKKFWTEKTRAAVLSTCGILMIAFGIYFIISAASFI